MVCDTLWYFLICNFFHDCEVALTSHICFPIRLVFHQHLILNSHIACSGIPPQPSNHTRGQFLHLPSYPLLRLLWSKSDNKSPERGFSTSITLALHLAQPHCASITKHEHHIWYHISNIIYRNVMSYDIWCPCLVMLAQCGWAKWSARVILVENPLSGDLVVRLRSE